MSEIKKGCCLCCLGCKRWRSIGKGKGECMYLEVYTKEYFYCKEYTDESK